jgi:polyhydroxybutyrate depolymerase
MGCSQVSEYQTQANKAGLVWDGQNRTYQIHVPANLAAKVPLVLVLHGAGGSGAYAARYTTMSEVADREGFIAVYPDGTAPLPALNNLRTWNAIHCCGGAYRKNVDDVGFLTALIKKLAREYHVDPKRVYVVGHSNGAMMAYRLAAEKSELIAAVAPLSGTIGGDPDTSDSDATIKIIPAPRNPVADATIKIIPAPRNPVAVAIFHGTADATVPYQGGEAEGIAGSRHRNDLSVAESSRFWVEANNCDPSPRQENVTPIGLERYSSCDDGSEVWVYSLKDFGHSWEMASPILADKSSTDLVWEFLAAHPKP